MNSQSKQHGGPGRGQGRKAEMAEPVRTTITLEKSHLDQLKAQHGRNWQKVLRSLVAAHIHAV